MKIDKLHVVLLFTSVACGAIAMLQSQTASKADLVATSQSAARPEAGPNSDSGSVSPSTEATARTILHHMYQCEVRSAQMQMAVVGSDVDKVKALLKREDQYRDLIQTNRVHMQSAVRSLSERDLLNLNAASRQAMLLFSQDGLADSPLPQRGAP